MATDQDGIPHDTASTPLPGAQATRPRASRATLARDRLVAPVLAAVEAPASVVVIRAGAGYGKTTLLLEAERRSPLAWVWCSCGSRLTDGPRLLARLHGAVAALGGRQAAPPRGRRASISDQVERLCDDVAGWPDGLVIAIDDVQGLRGRGAEECLALLAQRLPEQAGLVVAGRSAPPVALARLRLSGAIEITEDELALTAEEGRGLLEVWGSGLDPATADELHRLTEGWAAGMLLAARSPEAVADPAAACRRPLFGYLRDEVLGGLSSSELQVLARISVLDRFTPELAAAVAALPEARETIGRLAEQGSLIVAAAGPGGWLRLRAPVRRALGQLLAELGDADCRSAHARAAAEWLRLGEPGGAVHHHLRAGDRQAAADALASFVGRLASGSEAGPQGEWLDAIGEDVWRQRPELRLLHSSILLDACRHAAATVELEALLDALLEAGAEELAALCLLLLLRALEAGGGRDEHAIAVGADGLARVGRTVPGVPLIRVGLAALHAQAARFREAATELARARAGARGADAELVRLHADVVVAWAIDHPLGRSDDALRALDAAGAALLAAGDPGPPAEYALVEVLTRRALVLEDLGRHEEALDAAERLGGLARARPSASRAAAAVRVAALAGSERWTELEAELAHRAPRSGRADAGPMAHVFPAARARLALSRGDAEQVALEVDAARTALRAYNAPFARASALCRLALTAGAAGLAGLSPDLVEEAAAAASASGSPRASARALLAGAALRRGVARDRLLERALRATARDGLSELADGMDEGTAAALLDRAGARGLGPSGEAARLLGGAASRARERPTVVRLRPPAGPSATEAEERLRIISFGGFGVERGRDLLAPTAFGRRKAWVLLAILTCSGGPLHREILVEALWPELPLARALPALHSTLYSLRRTIDGSAGAANSRVVADGEAYRLALGAGDSWDAADFLGLARGARAAKETEAELERLLAAEAAHAAGPFLPEYPYAEWAAGRRSELERAHLEVLERLATVLVAHGRTDEAVTRLMRLADLEPEREEWQRELMRVYIRSGERPLALRHYHQWRIRLRDEFGVEPGPEMRALYDTLLREERPAIA
jgi:LuxR family maltose regulon positive regulatory protein